MKGPFLVLEIRIGYRHHRDPLEVLMLVLPIHAMTEPTDALMTVEIHETGRKCIVAISPVDRITSVATLHHIVHDDARMRRFERTSIIIEFFHFQVV
jgi:GTP-binding protein EngB required for normal cell division